MQFSLVMATYGRNHEVREFVESLLGQDFDLHKVELIIVDQNDAIDLSGIVADYSDRLNIKHIRSGRKGLSYNRNLGLDAAVGKYVCFPDDDCTYYPDTLKTVFGHLEANDAVAVFGAIRDRANGENIIRQWPRENRRLSRWNFFGLYSSITMFVRGNQLRFNENLGAGTYFGSYEDADYAYRLVRSGGRCDYFSNIEVKHPKIGIGQFSRSKNYSYGLGFGGFCASYGLDAVILGLFLLSVFYHLLKSVLCLLRMNMEGARKHYDSVASRINGYVQYRNHERQPR